MRVIPHAKPRENGTPAACEPCRGGAADVSLLGSNRKVVANVPLESIACGTPVVTTPIYRSPDVISRVEAGRLTESRGEDAIRSALRTCYPPLSDREATRRYAERHDWRRTCSRHPMVLAEASSSRA